MQNSNRNSVKPLSKIFTLLSFLLGLLLYIILRQSKKESDREVSRGTELVPKRKKLPKKVNKAKHIDKEIKSIKLSNRQEKIVKELIEREKMYPSELQELLPSVSARTVRRDMSDLERKGLVEQKGATKSTYYVYIGS